MQTSVPVSYTHLDVYKRQVIEQEAVLKAQSIVADAKVELEQLHVKTTDLLQQYDRYRTQYKALASAQLDLLNSEAFDIDVATMKAISGLEESAAEHTDQLQAEPVYAVEETESEETAVEQEEDFDETLSTDAVSYTHLDVYKRQLYNSL